MRILDTIIQHKHIEVANSKAERPVRQLESAAFFGREIISLKQRLLSKNNTGIIAEFKRRSPSKGVLNDSADPVEVVKQYEAAGVAGSSILTDTQFFGGSYKDLQHVRSQTGIPLLRKDFIIDEYQLIEARSIGADIVLLIAAVLTRQEVKQFTATAHNLGLEVLLELHGEEELDHVYHRVDMTGINNRNLKTFEVDTERSFRMAEKLGSGFVLVAESGISDTESILQFRKQGFSGFLMGEAFMCTNNPGKACSDFILQLQSLKKVD